MMQFESLPNEVLLDFFEYLDITPLFRAFYSLNIRFNSLLYNLCQAYYLDFERISKQDFDIICRKHLSLIKDRIVSLRLSDYYETPGLFKLLFSRGFTVPQFIHLRSFTMYRMSSEDMINILCDIHHLEHLIHFNIIECYSPYQQQDGPYFLNKIWALPKLKRFNLDCYFMNVIDFTSLLVTSSTLENVLITTGNACSFIDMTYIYQHTPYLRTLSMWIRCKNADEIFPITFTSMINLKLTFSGTSRVLYNLFQNIPNLRYLTIEMRDCYLNGYEWKQILITNLTKIKLFRFKMNIVLFRDDDREKRIDELLDTFRSSFWLDDHQWFVRCDWGSNHGSNFGFLYSLPYAFESFTSKGNGQSKWTSPDDRREHWLFDCVQYFDCETSEKEHLNLHPIHFPTIRHLFVSHPLHGQIWDFIPTFEHLTSLRTPIYGKLGESDLRILFDRAPHIYELIIIDPHKLDLLVLSRLTNRSVRHLRFIPDREFFPYIFDDEDCNTLAESSFGRQCEILSDVRVQSPSHIINLINTMNNLRAMTVYCKLEELSSTTTEFIDWLNNHLPTRCYISSCSVFKDTASIKLWFG